MYALYRNHKNLIVLTVFAKEEYAKIESLPPGPKTDIVFIDSGVDVKYLQAVDLQKTKKQKKIIYDVDKCRDIKLDKIRAKRNDLLTKYDLYSTRFFFDKQAMLKIENKKKQLRQLPTVAAEHLTQLSTVEQIDQYEPELLSQEVSI